MAFLEDFQNLLAAPRRAVWGDTTGADVLSNVFGADPENALTRGGGTLLDMLMDPVTYLAPAAIGGLAKGIPALTRMAGRTSQLAGVGGEIGELAAIRAAAQKASTLNALEAEGASAANAARMEGLRGVVDVPGIASGASKTYQQASPEAIEALTNLGIGQGTGGGGLNLMQSRLHPQIGVMRGGAGGGSRVGMQPGASVPSQGLTPYERYLMMQQQATGGPLNAVQSPDMLGMLGRRSLPVDPAMMGELSSLNPGMQYLQGMPVSTVFEAAQRELAQKLALRAAIQRSALSPGELAGIGSAGAAGALGGYLGQQQ